MKSRLDLLVSDVVALFLHHLWNDGACSVYRNRPKLGEFFFQLQMKKEFLVSMAIVVIIELIIVCVLKKKKNIVSTRVY